MHTEKEDRQWHLYDQLRSMDKRTYNDADTEAYTPDPDVRLPSVRREDNEEYDSRCNEAGDDGCVGA